MADAPDLWPDFQDEVPEATPADLLVQQADALTRRTAGRLRADVEFGSHGDWVTLDLYVIAPQLNDYSYRLFKVRYKPAKPFESVEIIVAAKDVRRAKDRASYEARVTDLLGSNETRSVIRELLAVSRQARQAIAVASG